MKITKDVIESIYAGWLGKVIGVRLGSPIEGMWYGRIKQEYGEITDYVFDYDLYAADDDTNGPLFFLRGLEDGGHGKNMNASDVGNALLNYAPYEHGFFWWGGYGISTEHTAYLNLRSGVKAGDSGSIALNGTSVAEQIGGQIFIDTWGLVAPGNPDLACKLARKAASVTHDGNGIYGGIFIATCISYAFIEKDINKIIEKGLSYIPKDCEYTRVVKSMIEYHKNHPDNWRSAYIYLRENFGYDKYPGNCHIIPNTGVIILSLLYGEGDYSKTICICNMCGWDTDCNAGNVGCIMGVVCGLDKIDEKWRKPINDLLICSSCVGSLNIMDLPYGVMYISKLACMLNGEDLCEPYKSIICDDDCHFELPYSTHALNVMLTGKDEEVSFKKKRYAEGEKKPKIRYSISNTDETAASGCRSLKIKVKYPKDEERVFVYKRTHYHPSDFTDSRYDPSFSPIAYPGQTIHISVYVPKSTYECKANICYYDVRHNKLGYGEDYIIKAGEWANLTFKMPKIKAGLIDAIGVCFTVKNPDNKRNDFVCNIDDLYITGKPNYSIDFSKETSERWNWKHIEVSQFTNLRGLLYLKDGYANLSGPDFAEAYTGDIKWKDYSCTCSFIPVIGKCHAFNFRVQGAMRSYSVGFYNGEFGIYKNYYGYKKLISKKYKLELGKEYTVEVSVKGNKILAKLDDIKLEYVDNKNPILSGSIGISNKNGSHTLYKEITVK